MRQPRLHTLNARLLLILHAVVEPLSYSVLAERLDVHQRSVKRVADEMIDAGWLTATRQHRYLKLTINPDIKISEGGTLGDWLERNTHSEPDEGAT